MQKCGNMRKIGTCHESVFRFLIWPPEVPFLVPFGTPKMRKKLFFVFWKFNWSNGVRENEMIIIWCISTTYSVKIYQKISYALTDHQEQFLIGSSIFHSPWHTHWVLPRVCGKLPKNKSFSKNWLWKREEICEFFLQKMEFKFSINGKNTKKW